MYQTRYDVGSDWGAIGDRFMGKTHTLQEIYARKIKEEKNSFAFYVDTMGDTLRYSYFNSFRRVSSVREITQYAEKGERRFILDLFSGGSFRNYMSQDHSYSSILADMILLFEHVKSQYPKMQFYAFFNEANLFFPNLPYTGELYRPQSYILKQGKHFNLVLFWCSPDTQGVSKLLIKETGQLLCFHISESNSLLYIEKQMAGMDRTSEGEIIKLNNIKIEVIKNLEPHHFIYLKGGQIYVK